MGDNATPGVDDFIYRFLEMGHSYRHGRSLSCFCLFRFDPVGLFASGVNHASSSMIEHANIIKKVYFPRIIIPASAILVSLLDYAITLFFYIVLIFYYEVKVTISIFLMYSGICLLITFFSTLGFGLFLAAANIRYRDLRYATPFLLQFLFFATPVIFPISSFTPGRLLLPSR